MPRPRTTAPPTNFIFDLSASNSLQPTCAVSLVQHLKETSLQDRPEPAIPTPADIEHPLSFKFTGSRRRPPATDVLYRCGTNCLRTSEHSRTYHGPGWSLCIMTHEPAEAHHHQVRVRRRGDRSSAVCDTVTATPLLSTNTVFIHACHICVGALLCMLLFIVCKKRAAHEMLLVCERILPPPA